MARADKIAVITGAGSGIGRALALQCAMRGMRLALLDLGQKGLEETRALLPAGAGEAMLCTCDVSQPEAVEQAAAAITEHLGGVDYLFNNAGVFTGGPVWSAPPEEWQWQFGVNVMGVANGIRSFVPRMIERGVPAHVINTASLGGHLALRGVGVYCATKFAVVAISESLHSDLRARGARIQVSVLCPSMVKTAIAAPQRPDGLTAQNPGAAALLEEARHSMDLAKLSADDVARITLEGVERGDFYIFPHSRSSTAIEQRLRAVLDGRVPTDISAPPRPR